VKKTLIGVVVGSVALGVWAGVRSSHSTEVMIQAGIATLVGGNLLLCLWAWFRAAPGSGDRMVLPPIMWLSASMLISIVPRLFWPDADGLRWATTILSIGITTAVLVVQIRQWRRRRAAARTT